MLLHLHANASVRKTTAPARTCLVVARTLLITIGLMAPQEAALAQLQITYRNTDIGRPVRTEDAYAVNRYSLDLHLAPLALERTGSSTYRWSVNPEIAYGLLPRTQIEIGVPLAYRDPAEGSRVGIAGVNLAALYNFNAETRAWPALGARAGVLLPVGGLGPATAHPFLTAIATRTVRNLRLHANSRYTFRNEPSLQGNGLPVGAAPIELSRWMTSVAVDRSFPLRSFLLAAETYAVQPFARGEKVQWNLGIGARFQFAPNMTADAGVSRRVSGVDPNWSVSFGVGRTIGLGTLLPGMGPWRGR